MAPPQQTPRSMAFIPTTCASDYMTLFTALMAVTFMATQVYRRNDFLFGDTDIAPSLAVSSLSPGLRAGRSVIENSSLFPEGAYSQSRRGYMPILDAMQKTEERVRSGEAAHIGHPCTRFVSAFEHMKSENLSTEEKEWAEKHIGSKTIDDFASELKSNPDLHYKNLFLPMSDAFFSENTFLFDGVACQESTTLGLSRISAQRGKSVPQDFFGTPLLANAHEACQDLSEETKAVIDKLYKRDYCIFGYDDLPQETPYCSQARMTKESLTQRYSDCMTAEDQNEKGDVIVHVWKPSTSSN